MKLATTILFSSMLVLVGAGSANADLPTEIDCFYNVSRNAASGFTDSGRPRFDQARHRMRVDLNTTLGLGETCEITHQACGSAFIPADLAPSSDDRTCIDFDSIGVSSIGAGDTKIIARTRSRVLAEFVRSGRGRQITYGAVATCTDGDTETTIECTPKARKLSVNNSPGASVNRVVRQMSKNFNG